MSPTEARLSRLEGRFDTLMTTLANRLNTMNEQTSGVKRHLNDRFVDLCVWLIALTGLAGAQLATVIVLAIMMSREGIRRIRVASPVDERP